MFYKYKNTTSFPYGNMTAQYVSHLIKLISVTKKDTLGKYNYIFKVIILMLIIVRNSKIFSKRTFK